MSILNFIEGLSPRNTFAAIQYESSAEKVAKKLTYGWLAANGISREEVRCITFRTCQLGSTYKKRLENREGEEVVVNPGWARALDNKGHLFDNPKNLKKFLRIFLIPGKQVRWGFPDATTERNRLALVKRMQEIEPETESNEFELRMIEVDCIQNLKAKEVFQLA
ncbi:hypothetical protein EB118_11495 [bacterium]|nr:hypothetical protein [bacterium]